MNVEDMIRRREESANTAFITFNKHISQGKMGLFCFFEGKDSPYYVARIRMFFNGNYYPIACSGKSKVLKINELIGFHKELEAYKTAFFVDKDFDPPILNPTIYETPYYAIENFYTHPKVFAEILKSELGFTEIEDSFNLCVQHYTHLQKEFHEAATLFNAWYACLIDQRHAAKVQTGVSLGDTPLPFVKIALTGISQNYDINLLRAKYPEALPIDNQIVETKKAAFSSQDKGKIFRGKFELDFMLKILTAFIDDSKTTKKFITRPIKYHITNTQAISQFSQYAETPVCLINYLKKRVV
ncbi:MAG: hypothetical protein RL329_2976 [Bacteroidota bacterium]|jgi:hypothetical protein